MTKEMLSALRMHNPQSQMFFISTKVAVLMQEVMFVLNAISGNQTINRFADRDSFSPQHPIITSAQQCQSRTDHFHLQILSKGAGR